MMCHACGSYRLRPTLIGHNAECEDCGDHTLIGGPCAGLPRWVRDGRCTDCGRPSEPLDAQEAAA